MDDLYKLSAVAVVLLGFSFVALGGVQAVRDWLSIGPWQRTIDRDARELR